MSEEIIAQPSARLDEASKRIDRLEREMDRPPPPKKPWWKPTTPSELVTTIGIPAALIAGLYTFYDSVWLKLQRLDAATITAAQDKLDELQDLRKEIFVLQTRGEDAEIAAVVDARQSRRDRLVNDSFVYWQQQPGYFTKKETILLAEELQLQSRQADALAVMAEIEGASPTEQSDLDRFKASLYGAESPVQDLDRARDLFRSAMQHADTLSSEAGKDQLSAKVTFHWLYTELSNETGCEPALPAAGALSELLADDPEAYNLASLDDDPRKLPVVFQDRGGPMAGPG